MTELTETGMTKAGNKILAVIDSYISAYEKAKPGRSPESITLKPKDFDSVISHYKDRPTIVTRKMVVLNRG